MCTSMLAIQELMGHVDPKSTAIYVELAMTQEDEDRRQGCPVLKDEDPGEASCSSACQR
jgi:hypothetical protein